ncbi:hypothetical protein VHUM_04068 [Vanrija humicola]|uniref:FAD/NAD(P)-binding domain-containing protein n=1 Tax=Vanrija humicola TaxID=5417 RepID=A0A7D8YWI7_VANHU|nr:hypothetical protein VHUM_04068 [Vanrija humicola]
MSPIALPKPAEPAPAPPKAAADTREPLPVHPDPIAPDFNYKFKYNHPLPTHGGEAVEIPADADVAAVTEGVVASLSDALVAQDAAAFAALFLEHGAWRDRAAFTWDYRTFNFRPQILKAAADLLPATSVRSVTLTSPAPLVKRPYGDLSYIQAHIDLTTDDIGASGLLTLVLTPEGYKIWTLNTAIERLLAFPELPDRDGHMTGPHSWAAQRAIDGELTDAEPDVLIVGGGQNGLMTAARLKALGVSSLVVERNPRLGDNWRGRYEALSLHFPYWADHFPYMPFPRHWPTYTPSAKLADWFEWYASALELTVWTGARVSGCHQAVDGGWTVTVDREGKAARTFHPKHVVMATSLAGIPRMPTIPGADTFKGTIKHSTQHDTSRGWEGKRVLVVGTSSSGFDTAYDFARRGIDVTLLQRSATYVMSLPNAVSRILADYAPAADGTRPDHEVADRIFFGTPAGQTEELMRRVTSELTELDHDLILGMERRGFKTWRGQRGTGKVTLNDTRHGGFYFEAGACAEIIKGTIRVEQGAVERFTADGVVLTGDRAQAYDLVIFATGFSNAVDSIRAALGDDVADRTKQIWGVDEEGEINAAWRDCGVKNMWIMVGALQQARYHSHKVALRIKARLEGVRGADAPYLAPV